MKSFPLGLLGCPVRCICGQERIFARKVSYSELGQFRQVAITEGKRLPHLKLSGIQVNHYPVFSE
jgi:hypothetical protein